MHAITYTCIITFTYTHPHESISICAIQTRLDSSNVIDYKSNFENYKKAHSHSPPTSVVVVVVAGGGVVVVA